MTNPNPPVVGTDGHSSAVYQIHNKNTGEYYIGASSKIVKRIKDHIYSLRNNRHENINLQNSFNNDENKDFEIAIFPVEGADLAFKIEKELIKNHKHKPNFLNIKDSCPPPMSGRRHSEETKRKIREASIKQFSDPKKREFIGNIHRKRMEDPVNREISRQAAIKQWNIPGMKENIINKVNKKFSNTSFKKEFNKKIIEANNKTVIINGKTYISVKEAIKDLQISEKTYYKHYGNKKGERK